MRIVIRVVFRIFFKEVYNFFFWKEGGLSIKDFLVLLVNLDRFRG